MDPIREHMTRATLALFPAPYHLTGLLLQRGGRPMLVRTRERPLPAGDWLVLGKRYRVDLLMLREHGLTWS